MHGVYRFIRQHSVSSDPVLIRGEKGCGKELIARAIHSNSLNKNNPFIYIDCKKVNGLKAENQLFAIHKIFTDEQDYTIALYFDEIGELEIRAQKNLIRNFLNRYHGRVQIFASSSENLERGVDKLTI